MLSEALRLVALDAVSVGKALTGSFGFESGQLVMKPAASE